MNRNLFNFNLLLGFSALFIAGCAAFFSIWGIGLLFSGASIASMVMASSLELGKLVATSFLYRYWNQSKWILKSYLCGAVFILMLITSLGIFGYLTSAYQQSSIKYSMMMDTIKLLEEQKTQEQLKITEVKSRVGSLLSLRKTQESRLSEINTNSLLARNPIQFRQVQDQTMELIDQTDKNIKAENEKSLTYSSAIDNIDKKISELKLSTSANKDIQTFKFVADELNMNLNTVVKWFIVVLIFVFDPLAVALILAYNMSMSKEYAIYKPNKSENDNSKVSSSDVVVETQKENVVDEIKDQEENVNNLETIIEKYDENHDGKLDEEETKKIVKNQGDDFFKRYFSHR